MEETLDYIDRYFQGELSEADRLAFEQRCETDNSFAEAVAFYIKARQGLKQELLEAKRADFDQLYRQLSEQSAKPRARLRKLVTYIGTAAAAVLLFLGWYLLFRHPSPQQLANQYIHTNFSMLSVTMSSKPDSLQQGLAAFNQRDYAAAERILSALSQQNDPEAGKYLGILYLVNDQYDKAIIQFDALANNPHLYSNPGLFYKAITLMKRSVGDDRRQAKTLLQEIVDKDLAGSSEAAGWLRNF